MRTLTILLFACVLTPAYTQQKGLPTNGNGLLESCGVLVAVADDPTTYSSLSRERFSEKMGQLDWCGGYLDATHDFLMQNQVNLAVIGMTGVTLAGPDKEKEYAFDTLRGPCIPGEVSILQMARVLVKWLKDHPGNRSQ